ncbi:MAG: processing protein [Clostridiales bacterium]|jgi:DNA processing protein|nr:processing protein [Clostridiales bacterium]
MYYFNYFCLQQLKPAIGSKSVRHILNHFGGYEMISWREIALKKMLFNIEEKILLPSESNDCPFKSAYQRHLRELSERQTAVVLPGRVSYPQNLIQDKPLAEVLYVKGQESLLTKGIKIAIVGSRTPTAYGRRVATALSTYLAERGICLVSGMAMGIDGVVHRSALAVGGKTIAVLATGVNRPYPSCHSDLYRQILDRSGAIVSERGFEETAKPYHFPYRNRLISGISDAVIVVEAAEKSGSLTTVQHGLEQGKPIFAVPGSLFSEMSKGPNRLIYDGAIPLIDFSVVTEMFGISGTTQTGTTQKRMMPENHHFSEVALRIYEFLSSRKCAEIDAISAELNIEYSDIIKALGELTLDDFCEFQSLTRVCIK